MALPTDKTRREFLMAALSAPVMATPLPRLLDMLPKPDEPVPTRIEFAPIPFQSPDPVLMEAIEAARAGIHEVCFIPSPYLVSIKQNDEICWSSRLDIEQWRDKG